MGWLTKKNEGSSSPCGTYPGSRTMQEHIRKGVIPLDKPSGPTSNQVDSWVKDILHVKKCSHGGTLDPRVSGVLVIALESATKLMPIILSSKKEYVGVVHLHKDIEREKVVEIFKTLVGRVRQLPPVRSAVARWVRERDIYYVELLEIDGRNVMFKIGCEAGFYVRRFADDLGRKLGIGAHLQELRRTKSGSFSEDRLVTLQNLFDAVGDDEKIREVILPLESAVESVGKVVISDNAVENICNGSPLAVGGIVKLEEFIKKGDWIGIMTLKGELVAIGRALISTDEMMKSTKGLAVKTDKVIMSKGTYLRA
ncbi:MAG: RNA-guided pseudouridylation complex pseudouridine synthase subunit Cbf5 [Candidatus Aenigmatarchaeota archaeon]